MSAVALPSHARRKLGAANEKIAASRHAGSAGDRRTPRADSFLPLARAAFNARRFVHFRRLGGYSVMSLEEKS